MILIILLIVVGLFGTASIVTRIRLDRALDKAIADIPKSPRLAYEGIRDSFASGNWLTFGYVNHARRAFIEALALNGKNNLSPKAIEVSTDSFRIARQCMSMLGQIEADTGLNLTEYKAAIIRTGFETSNIVLSEGTLSAWNETIEFFHYLHANKLIPAPLMADYQRWNEQVRTVPVRQLAMRQEGTAAINLLTGALNQLGLTVHRAGDGPLALAAPADIGLTPLDEADRDIIRAINALDSLFIRYDDGSGDMVRLYELRGILAYNHAAIMLTHVIDQGPMARRFGTGFIASLMIRPEDRRVPPAGEMYQNFLNLTVLVFNGSRFGKGAADFFKLIPEPSDKVKAYFALCAWNSAMCLEKQGRDPSFYRGQAEKIAAQITDESARDAIQSMRSATRPLLIVEIPAEN